MWTPNSKPEQQPVKELVPGALATCGGLWSWLQFLQESNEICSSSRIWAAESSAGEVPASMPGVKGSLCLCLSGSKFPSSISQAWIVFIPTGPMLPQVLPEVAGPSRSPPDNLTAETQATEESLFRKDCSEAQGSHLEVSCPEQDVPRPGTQNQTSWPPYCPALPAYGRARI